MKQRVKKLLAGFLGFGLIVLLLIFTNSLTGNPLSAAWAKRAAKNYLEANYPALKLEIQQTGYSFKSGAYRVFAQSPTSRDTAFSVHVDGWGNIVQDDYEHEVANGFTTFRRLDEELRAIGGELIGSLPYEFEFAALAFADKGDLEPLKRDMELDVHSPPLPLQAEVVVYSEELTYDKIAQVAKEVETALEKAEIPVGAYSVRLLPTANQPEDKNQAASWAGSLAVSGFPAPRMAEKNLAAAMEQFEAQRAAAENAEKEKELSAQP